MNILEFTILGLATWRISYMLVWEDGPFFVFWRLRGQVGVGKSDSFFAQLFGCIYCTSMWVGIFFAALFYVTPTTSFIVALPFALSSVVFAMERIRE